MRRLWMLVVLMASGCFPLKPEHEDDEDNEDNDDDTACEQDGLPVGTEACTDEDLGASLSVPDDITFPWHSSYNDLDDGIGKMVQADVTVVSDSSGLPLEDIQVEVTSDYGGVGLIPWEAVTMVAYPEAPVADVQDAEDVRELREQCVDEDGNFAHTGEWCAWYWDTESGRYYEIDADYADAEGYLPDYYVGATDNGGLLRMYVYVDALPSGSNESYDSVFIYASIQVSSSSFSVGPE